MTYADLIKLMEPHADEEVFFNGYEDRAKTEVHFYGRAELFLALFRKYGKDEVTFEQR